MELATEKSRTKAIIQCMGEGVLVINNRGDWWGGARVQTRWRNAKFIPAAWSGRYDSSMPEEKWSDEDGICDFWAAPRGYAVYLPRNEKPLP